MFIQFLLILVAVSQTKMEPGNRLSSIMYICVTDTVNIVSLHVQEHKDPRNQRETVGVYIGVILLPVLADFMYCSIVCSISEAKLTFYGSFRFYLWFFYV